MYMVLEFRANVTRNPFPKQFMTHLYLNLVDFSAIFILKSNNVAICSFQVTSVAVTCGRVFCKQSNPYFLKISILSS